MEELLFDRIRMKISDAQFRVSTDSMVLADFCRIRPGGRVLDLGCGCGTLGLLLLGADETLRVSGIEIQEAAARQAQENAEENGFSAHMHIICGDLRQAHAQIAPGTFDYVLSNPPFGREWKNEKAAVEAEAKRGFAGKLTIRPGRQVFSS